MVFSEKSNMLHVFTESNDGIEWSFNVNKTDLSSLKISAPSLACISRDSTHSYVYCRDRNSINVLTNDFTRDDFQLVQSQLINSGRFLAAMKLSPQGTHLAAVDLAASKLYLFQIDKLTGKLQLLQEEQDTIGPNGKMIPLQRGLNLVRDCQFSPDGKYLCTLNQDGVGTWEIPADGKARHIKYFAPQNTDEVIEKGGTVNVIHSGKDLAFMNQGKHLVVSDSGTSSLVVFDFSKFLSSKELPVVTRRNYKDPGFEVLEGIGEIESTIDGEKLLISSIMCPLVMLSLE